MRPDSDFEARVDAHSRALVRLLSPNGQSDPAELRAGIEQCRSFIASGIPAGGADELWSMFTTSTWKGRPEIEDLFVTYARAGCLGDLGGIEGAKLLEAAVCTVRPDILKCLLLAGANESLVPTPARRKVLHCRTNAVVTVTNLEELIDADCDSEDGEAEVMLADLRAYRMIKQLQSSSVTPAVAAPAAREKSSPLRRARAI